MPLETGCRQGARHARGDGADQIDIAVVYAPRV